MRATYAPEAQRIAQAGLTLTLTLFLTLTLTLTKAAGAPSGEPFRCELWLRYQLGVEVRT